MQRLFYQLILLLALPLIPLRLLWRGMKQPGYLQNVGERFGWHGGAVPTNRPLIWIHAVSVGEVRAAQPLIEALSVAHPGHDFLVTVMTPTGRETALSLLAKHARIVYLPYDYAATVARFLDHFRPHLGIIMETELWPNLLAECARRRLPVALVNARLSEKSARGYARFSQISGQALGSLTFVSAQSQADADRLSALGAKRVEVTGNLKFDMPLDPTNVSLGQRWRAALPVDRKVVVVASSREGEEALVLDAWQSLPANIRNEHLLVLVPRHPQRFDEVAALIESRAFTLGRRSLAAPTNCAVWLGDSMGEMAAFYALADIVIMGGSLLDFGSQNLIEPCAQGRPVVLGPSIFNFQEAASLAVREGAAKQVAAAPQTVACAIDWLRQPEEMRRAAEAALRFTAAHRGATARTLALMAPLLRS